MKSLKLLMFLPIAVVLMAGCSVEKRLYTSGYHVEWGSRRHTPEKSVSVLPIKKIVQSCSDKTENQLVEVHAEKEEPELMASTEKSNFQIRDMKMKHIFQIEQDTAKQGAEKKKTIEFSTEKVIESHALESFFMPIIFLLLLVFLYSLPLSLVGVIALSSPIISLLTIIDGFVGISRTKKNRDKYLGSSYTFSILGLILGLLLAVFSIIVLIAFF